MFGLFTTTTAPTTITVVVYTCATKRGYQPTATADRSYYGFSSYEEAVDSGYGDWIWEVTLQLRKEWEESFSYSTGKGDRAHGEEWGYSNGWYEYSPPCIKKTTLVSAPNCR